MKEPDYTNADATPRGKRGLLLLRKRGQVFAVEAEEAEGVAEAADPAPLPHAPAAVLGVVCVRGRMYTLLDPQALAAAREDRQPPGARRDSQTPEEEGGRPADEGARGGRPRFAVALRGDEQLALAADAVEGPLDIPHGALEPPDPRAAPLRATLEHNGERVHLLNTAALFDAAMQGTERRRQRS